MVSAQGLNGTVHFDGQTLTIERKGFLARSMQGSGSKTIPLTSIAAVQWKAPSALVNGYIAFTILGGIERQAQVGLQLDAAKDENAVMVKKSQAGAFAELKAAVEAAVLSSRQTAPSGPGVADIGQLAALHAQGALTDEEFAAAKARALGL